MANKTKEECDKIIESGVCHFTIGEDLGLRLMEIAQEHLTEGNNPVKALKTITESLTGCPTDLAVRILKGEMVLPVDVDTQQVICQDRIPVVHDRFPKVDPCYWISRRAESIEEHGNNLIAGYKELQKQIRLSNRHLTVDIPYDDIFKFVSGTDQDMLDYLRDNFYEVDAIANLIEATKRYIEFSMSIISTMDWMLKTFDEFADSELFMKYNYELKGACSQMLTDVMSVMKETMSFDFNLREHEEHDDVAKYIEATREIDAIVEKGIEPVDIMDKYNAGWLSPDGVFYGLNGEIANMLHIQIADALVEKGIIPLKDEHGDNVEGALADQWLEQNGWIKIHEDSVNFGGCLNDKMGKKNINITNVQAKMIYEYISIHYNGIVVLGWKRQRVGATKFKDLVDVNPEYLNKEYFEF
jgi:hypothetical protein